MDLGIPAMGIRDDEGDAVVDRFWHSRYRCER